MAFEIHHKNIGLVQTHSNLGQLETTFLHCVLEAQEALIRRLVGLKIDDFRLERSGKSSNFVVFPNFSEFQPFAPPTFDE